jgi:hypothetical protein
MSITPIKINQTFLPEQTPVENNSIQTKTPDLPAQGNKQNAISNLDNQGDFMKSRLNNKLDNNLPAGNLIAYPGPDSVDPRNDPPYNNRGSLGEYSQSDSRWSNDKYEFANLENPDSHTIGSDGCTITALTNVLGAAVVKDGQYAPDVSDTNKRNSKFFAAFDNAKFEDLTGKGNQLKRRFNVSNSIEGLNPSGGKLTPIGIVGIKKDAKGKPIKDAGFGGYKLTAKYVQPEPQLLKDIKAAVKSGKPVLLGLSRNADKKTWVKTGDSRDSWVRHTIAAVDVDKKTGELIVLDSADGKRKTLKSAMETWGDSNIDMAYAVSAKSKK